MIAADGWKGTKAAWKLLFEHVVILQCFLHAWLKVRDRGKHLKDRFAEVSRRVWEAYHAPDRRCFGQRIRSLRTWAEGNLGGVDASPVGRHGHLHSVTLTLPPLGAIFLKPE